MIDSDLIKTENVDKIVTEFIKRSLPKLTFDQFMETLTKLPFIVKCDIANRIIELSKPNVNLKTEKDEPNANCITDENEYDSISDEYCGFKIVKKGAKFNYIDRQGNLLSPNLWFDRVWEFRLPWDIRIAFARVYIRGKGCNFLKSNGELLSPRQWFVDAFDFKEGFAPVCTGDNEWNYINYKGELLLHSPLYFATEFHNDFAVVCEDVNKWNFLKPNGELLFPNMSFEYVRRFEDGIAFGRKDGKTYIIDKYGDYRHDEKYDKMEFFHQVTNFIDGFAIVEKTVHVHTVQNLLKPNGELVSPNLWFGHVWGRFHDGMCVVRLDGKYNFIDTNGELLSPTKWFDSATSFINGNARVVIGENYYIIDKNGKLKFDKPIKLHESIIC